MEARYLPRLKKKKKQNESNSTKNTLTYFIKFI